MTLPIEKYSILFWLKKYNIQTEMGVPIDFSQRRYLLDIYTDNSPIKVIRKSSQAGLSTQATLEAIHKARFYRLNQIYTLPTDNDMQFFVNQKVNMLIRQNPIIQSYIGNKDISNISQKQIGSNFISYRGAFHEGKARMISSDINYYDELDTSNINVIKEYRSRLENSKLSYERFFSTPSVPGVGIDLEFLESDQKHWRLNCPHCNHRQHLSWESNVDKKKKIYICEQCLKELTLEVINGTGQWEARYPNRQKSGYWLNQMIYKPAKKLIEDEENNTKQYFYNHILGLPYLSADQKIPKALFIANRKKFEPKNPIIIGMDVGITNHYVVGDLNGIFDAGVLEDDNSMNRWEKFEVLLDQHKPYISLVDANPYTTDVLDIAKKDKYLYKIFIAYYMDKKAGTNLASWNEDQGKGKDFYDYIKVYINRTRTVDEFINSLKRRNILFDMDLFDQVVAHFETLYAVFKQNEFGLKYKIWASTNGIDHYAHACFLYYIARLRVS